MTVVQRTSGAMRLNPHLHVVFLDGAYHEDGTELVWNELGHLPTRAVGQVLEHAVGRMLHYLRRHGHLEIEHDVEEDDEPEAALCASAVSGREPRHTSSPRASPWRKRIGPRPAKPQEPTKADDDAAPKRKRGGYRAVDKPRRDLAPHICDRCPRVPSLQGADEARRHGDRAKERLPVAIAKEEAMATRVEWAERVERWERSRLSAEKFARREGYKPEQQSSWRWKLRADGPSQPSPSSLAEPPRFLPVHVVADASPVVTEPIEIALPNGRVVRVRPGFDPATLERVLALAAEETSC
ncbi:transposase [Sorangium sp. So ce367]|uniref:IS66 family insertion sequence element accessory protein TnpA n=1 Tax=Sorangium sp. So ce367 TaxID=3133305 RepID=UPI003F62995A